MLDFSKQEAQKEIYQTSMSTFDAMETFRSEVSSYGLNVDSIIPDGEIHRHDTVGKPHKQNGWYCFKEISSGYFLGNYGDWTDPDNNHKWRSWNEKTLPDIDRQFVSGAIQRYEQERKAKAEAEQIDKAAWVSSYVNSLPPCHENFPYLKRKNSRIYGNILYDSTKDCMVIPLTDVDGYLIGCQQIYDQPVSTKSGAVTDKITHGVIDRAERRPFYSILGDPSNVYIAEGYSTAASIHEATGNTVIVALFAGRLSAIGKIVRERMPDANIIFAADNDCENKENVGVIKARKAAEVIGAEVVIPELGGRKCDWNDIHCEMGLETLKTCLGVDGRSIFGICDFMDIMEEEYPDNPIIDGLLDEQESMLIVGESNIGKSLITLTLAASIGNPTLPEEQPEVKEEDGLSFGYGTRLFDTFPIRTHSKTLFIQSENGGKSIQGRGKKMIKGNDLFRNAIHSGSIKFMTMNGNRNPCVQGSFSDHTFYKNVVIAIKQLGVRVLIVDPFISFHDVEENDNAAMRRMLDNTFKRLMNETGVSIIFIHHMGKEKSRGGRGASALKDWCDSELIVNEVKTFDDGEGILRFDYTKSRNFNKKPSKWYVRRTKTLCIQHEPEFEEIEDEPEKKSGKILCDTQDVVDIITENGGSVMKMKTLVDMIHINKGCSKASTDRAIKKAVGSGLIEKVDWGMSKGHEFKISTKNE